MRSVRTFYFLLLPLVFASCGGGKPATPPRPPVFQLLLLAGASPSAVDSVLGKPTEVTRIRRIPEQMPGEFRDYELSDAPGPITVRFFRGRAVFFTVFLPEPEESSRRALQRVGIEVGEAPPDTRALLADWWRDGIVSGTSYVRVGALKNMGGEGEGFDMIQAEFR